MRFEFLRFFLILIFTNYKKIYFIFIFIFLVNFCWVGVVGVVKTPRMSTYHIICAVLYVLYGTYLYHTVCLHFHLIIIHQGCTVKNLIIVSSHTCDEHFLVSISTR